MLMIKTTPTHNKHQKAQGLMEFALALPLFLLLLFGVIEMGRLLMTFSAVFSAAREAARYGAAVGTTDAGVQLDHDCAGMREAAIRVGFLGGVQANQVSIRLLNPDGTVKDAEWCTTDNSYKESRLSDIIEVKVDGKFWSILPVVNLPNLPVSSTSTRTIVQNVEVYGTPQPTTIVAENLNALILTLDINPPGSGTITKNPDKLTYVQDDVVTLIPNPSAGWEFSHWSHDLSGNQIPNSILMTGNKLVTANFIQAHYTLTMNVTPSGSGTISVNPNSADYVYGEVVTLTAEPAPGYEFLGWSDDLNSNSPTASLTMDGNKTVTAIFNQLEYSLTIDTDGEGSVSTNLSGPYHYGDQVILTATAEKGWNFSVWSGDLIGGANPATIVMDDNKTITATFEQGTFTLSTTVNGGGKIVKYPDRSAFLPGTQVTLTAVPDPGWAFSFWSNNVVDDPGQNPNKIVMNSDQIVGVSFIQAEYSLTVNVIGSGSVSVSLDPPYSFNEVVTLTPHPAPGWVFAGWSDGIVGTDNPSSITINGNKIVNANFTPIEYTLVISITGQGTVNVNPSQPTYQYGDVVQLTAIESLDYTFTRWGGDLSGSTNPISITMDDNKAVAATFTRNCVSPSLISVTMSGGIGSKDVNFNIANNSSLDITLLSMVVRWTTNGGKLQGIYFGSDPTPIWSGSIHENSSPFLVSIWATGISRVIPKGTTTTMRINFSHDVDTTNLAPITFSNVCSVN